MKDEESNSQKALLSTSAEPRIPSTTLSEIIGVLSVAVALARFDQVTPHGLTAAIGFVGCVVAWRALKGPR